MKKISKCFFIGVWLAATAPAGAVKASPGTFTEVMRLLQAHAEPFDPDKIEQAAVEAVVQAVDPQARVVSTNECRSMLERRAGRLSDIGVRVALSNEQYRVTHVQPDSPAEEAGILENEILRTLDGREVTGQRLVAVMQQMRGTGTETLTLSLRAVTGEDRVVEVKPVRTQAAPVDWSERLPADLGYIKVNGLYPGASESIRKTLEAWEQEKLFGVLLDLRNAGGQDLDEAAGIAGLYAPKNSTLFILKDRAGQPVKYFTALDNGSITMPTMVLVNRQTTGAAELLAAILSQNGRGAMLFGETTSADPTIREFIPLGSSNYVYLATQALHLNDGRIMDGKEGLTPDVVVADGNIKANDFKPPIRFTPVHAKAEEGEHERLKDRVKYDAVLQRAVDVLLGLKALNIRTSRGTEPASG